VVEQYGEDWVLPENIVVNGPYIMTEWVQTNIMVLEKNPTYYNADSVDIEKVTILHVPEASTAMAMYENDEIDTVEVPPEDLDRVKADAVLSKEFYNGPRFVLYWYGFTANQPPFDNLLVRKAFAAAIDKVTLTEKITRGGQVPAPTMTPPGSFGHVPPSEGVGIPYNPAQAKAWLAEAGYPGGRGLPTVSLGYNANELNANVAQAIQKMWLDTLGVQVELKGFDSGYNEAVSAGAFSIHRHGWGMDYPDAQNVIHEVFRTKSTVTDPSFSVNLVIPEFDEIADKAAVEQDPAKRYEMYVEAERLLVETYAAQIPLFWYAQNTLTKPYLDRPPVPSFGQSWYLWKVNK
jgi:oligopeptide transport system substrate-binding protein